jgi:bifunctional non-homologous end joining protein LigD
MLATLSREAVVGPEWVYEEKYDGIRAIAQRRDRRVRLISRNGNDITAGFPEIARGLEALPGGDLVIDGEVVALDPAGVSRFQLLQRRGMAGGSSVPQRFAAFDVLSREGRSLLRAALAERRRELESLLGGASGPVFISRRLPRDGRAAYEIAQREGWEGIIAKDERSAYIPGARSDRWRKVKVRRQAEFVIGGYTPPAGSRTHLGSLLVGLYDGDRLRYVGAVGTGFTHATLADVEQRLRPLHRASPPFVPAPRVSDATWVSPELVAQIAYAEWTADGKLRHPVFLGFREDESPRECRWSERE